MKSDSLPFLACILVGSLALTPVAVTQTTTTITATPNPAAAGAQIDLTGTVQPNLTWTARPIPIPTGTITFVDGTAPLNATPIPIAPAPRFVSATFQQVFGSIDPSLVSHGQIATSNLKGITGSFTGGAQPDLLVEGGDSVQVFPSDGKGGFQALPAQKLSFVLPPLPPTCPILSFVASGNAPIDVNGDGKLDLLSGLQVACGDGDGTFQQPVALPIPAGFAGAFASDVNADGKTDIIAINPPPASPPNCTGAGGTSPCPTFQYEVTVVPELISAPSPSLAHISLGLFLITSSVSLFTT